MTDDLVTGTPALNTFGQGLSVPLYQDHRRAAVGAQTRNFRKAIQTVIDSLRPVHEGTQPPAWAGQTTVLPIINGKRANEPLPVDGITHEEYLTCDETTLVRVRDGLIALWPVPADKTREVT